MKFLADFFGFVGPLSISAILTYVNETQSIINHDSINTSSTNLTSSSADNAADQKTLVDEVARFLANGYVLAFLVLISTFLQSTFSNNFNHFAISEGIHLRSALQVGLKNAGDYHCC